uniref:cDNA sequence BC048679 n=1 Tax=Cricetulus griseus TaxID=10029 RepID=A0A8C2LND5_CRIGR
MSFSSQAHFSTQSLAGASSIFAFFFSEKFVSQHFQDVELDQGDPQPGDLYVFQLQSSKTQRCGAHVGVYCGRGEIIHLESMTSSGSGLQMLLEHCESVVHKEGLYSMMHTRKLLRVLRKRDGIDPKVLDQRVHTAMNSVPPRYHPISSNCVHFALNLLGMDSMSVDLDFTRN